MQSSALVMNSMDGFRLVPSGHCAQQVIDVRESKVGNTQMGRGKGMKWRSSRGAQQMPLASSTTPKYIYRTP